MLLTVRMTGGGADAPPGPRSWARLCWWYSDECTSVTKQAVRTAEGFQDVKADFATHGCLMRVRLRYCVGS